MAIYFNSRSSADDFTLEMTETSVNLKVGEQKDLKIEVNRNEAEISYITTSSTNAITVTKTNDCLHITATNEGSASIVVKAKYKGETKTARCDIIVSKLSVFDIEITDTQNCEFVNNTLNCFENSISFKVQITGLSASRTPDVKVLSGDIICTKQMGRFVLMVNQDGKIAIIAEGEGLEFVIDVKILLHNAKKG